MRKIKTMDSKKGRILFVEDEKALVDIYHDFFKKEGYDFLTTSDIGDAMIIAECEQPDIVLLDIIIPKPENTMAEQGYDFLKMIKENPRTKHIPVMAFTNLDTPEDRKKCREMGAAGYIFKRDCTPREVLETVEMVIKKHKKEK